MSNEPQLKRTPLYAEHLRLGAKMVPFAGWDMPVQFVSIIKEHRSVRESAGMFDVSHMGEFRVRGPGALEFLQRLTPNDLSKVSVGGSQYSSLLNVDAGMLDDIFIYHLDDGFLVVVNASNVDKVDRWFADNDSPGVDVVNDSVDTALVAVQGPNAVGIVQKIAESDLGTLDRRGIRPAIVGGVHCLTARTGYTGEDGLEIFCEANDASLLWTRLLDVEGQPIQPCGLGARDTLRLEAGNLLYGHDMDESVNPLEAGLGFTVKFSKPDFIGRGALLRVEAEGVRRRLVGFELLDRGIPRAEYVLQLAGRTVGHVTSGTYSPTLERSIGLGYVEPPLATVGQDLDVVIRDKPARASVVKLPFYRSSQRAKITTPAKLV